MVHKTTRLIAHAFDESGIKYKLEEVDNYSIITAAYDIEAGPTVSVNFISDSDMNDVIVYIHGLLHRVPASKRSSLLETLNTIHKNSPVFTFYLDDSSTVNVKTELPYGVADCCIGTLCRNLYFLSMIVLQDIYPVLANALYSSNETKPISSELVAFLREMKKNPIPIDSEQSNNDQIQNATEPSP